MTNSIDDFDMRDPLARYARNLYRGADDSDPSARSTTSCDRYLSDLRWFDGWLDEHGLSVAEVRPVDAEDIGHTLSQEYSGSTRRSRWRQINKLYQYLVRSEIIDENPLERWDSDKLEIFGWSNTTRQEKELEDGERYALSQSEVRKMEESVPDPRLRNQLLIRLMWQTGCRVEETTSIKRSDIDFEARNIHLPGGNTKNSKPRVVPYQPTLDGLLDKWINDGYRDRFKYSRGSDYLFVTRHSGQLSVSHARQVIVDAAFNASLNRVLYTDASGRDRYKITPHNLRHGYGTYMIQETDASLYEVSQLMGHSSTEVTERRYIDSSPDSGVEAGRQYGPD